MAAKSKSVIKAETDFTMLECIENFIKDGINPLGNSITCNGNSIIISSRNLFQYFSTTDLKFALVFKGGYHD